MNEYFSSEEKKEELRKLLYEWKGTPHRHLVAIKGKGADCTLFCWEILKEIGAMKDLRVDNIPMKEGYINYPQDRAVHNKDEILLQVLESVPILKTIFKGKVGSFVGVPKDGDVCCYQFGKSTAHMGIYFEGRVWQSLTNTEVYPEPFGTPKFKKRLSAIFRLVEVTDE